MNRRTYLGAVAGVVVSACAGCVSDSGASAAPDQNSDEGEATAATEPTTRPATATAKPTLQEATTADRSERAGANSNPETPPTVNERLLNPSNTTTQKVIALENRESITEVAEDADSIDILNDYADPRDIEVTIATKSQPDEPLYHDRIRFEPNAQISFQVTKPRTYRITVATSARPDTEPITFETDDCNDQSLSVTVTGDGSVEPFVQSTLAQCVSWPF